MRLYDRDIRRQVQLRRRLTKYALFAGCKTGRILKAEFPRHWDQIVWEEASKEIGGHSASVFPADLDHMLGVIEEFNPRVILGFGHIACGALTKIASEYVVTGTLLYAPHPTAREPGVRGEIRLMASRLNDLVPPRPQEIEM